MAAYNFESKGLVDAILTPIAVCEAVEMNESIVVPKIFRSSNCMWDTGATNTDRNNSVKRRSDVNVERRL